MATNAITEFKNRYAGMPTMTDKLDAVTSMEMMLAYEQAWNKIYKVLSEARGDVNYATYAKQTQLLKQIGAELDTMGAKISRYLSKSMAKVAEYSTRVAIKDLEALGTKLTKADEWHYKYNRDYADNMFKDNFGHIAAHTDKLKEEVKGQLRQDAANIFRRAAVEGMSRRDATKALKEELGKSMPDFKFIDKRGRRWDTPTYLKMLTQTVLHNASRECYINTLTQEGQDLVKVSMHGNPCSMCRPLQGQVLSITGADKDHMSLAEAMNRGLFHPRCKHRLLAYHEDIEEVFKKVDEGKSKEEIADERIAEKKATEAKVYSKENFEQIGPQAGSNEGGLFRNKVTGEKFYIKIPRSAEHAQNEFLATELYKLAGAEVPNLKLLNWGGRTAIASQWNEGLQKPDVNSKLVIKKFQKAFAADAWLANWDVVGLSYDNIALTKAGNPFRLDAGGSLLFRAQGSAKGALFGEKVTETATLRNSGINAQAAKVFGDIPDTVLMNSIKTIEKIKANDIMAAIEKAGFSGPQADFLYKTLLARQEDLHKQRLELYYKAKSARSAGAVEAPGGGWYFEKPTEEDYRLLRDHFQYRSWAEYSKVENLMKKYGMNREQATSIAMYTNGSYGYLNKYLRTERDQAQNRTWVVAHTRILNEALEIMRQKTGPYNGEVTRKLETNIEDFKKHWCQSEGAINQAFDFWSTSSRDMWSGNIVLHIKSKTGIDVDKYSTHSGEYEVLMKVGTKYKTIRWSGSVYHLDVWMEEI